MNRKCFQNREAILRFAQAYGEQTFEDLSCNGCDYHTLVIAQVMVTK